MSQGDRLRLLLTLLALSGLTAAALFWSVSAAPAWQAPAVDAAGAADQPLPRLRAAADEPPFAGEPGVRVLAGMLPAAGVEEAGIEPLHERARPGSEAAWLDHWSRLWTSDPSAFRSQASGWLRDSTPSVAKVALLQVAYGCDRELGVGLVRELLLRRDAEPSLQAFGIRFLGRAAADGATTLEPLASCLRSRPDDASLRCEALCTLLRHGDAAQLRVCLELLAEERDESVLTRACKVIAQRDLHWVRGAMEELALMHPVAALGARIRAEL